MEKLPLDHAPCSSHVLQLRAGILYVPYRVPRLTSSPHSLLLFPPAASATWATALLETCGTQSPLRAFLPGTVLSGMLAQLAPLTPSVICFNVILPQTFHYRLT